MTAVYTVRFGGGYAPSGGQLTLFTATDQANWVLRDVRLAHLGSVAADMYIGIVTGTSLVPIARANLAALGVLAFEGRQVLEPGDRIIAASESQPFAALVTGYRFSLTPTQLEHNPPFDLGR